jgi:hypothetical protein
VLIGEATNTNFIVFGLTRPGLEPMIYSTRGEHANHYATDAVILNGNPKNFACLLITIHGYDILIQLLLQELLSFLF